MERLTPKKPNTAKNFDEVWLGDAKKRIRQWDKYRYLALMVNIKNGQKVVELGCGCSELLQLVKNKFPACEVHGLDFSSYAINEMKWYNPNIKYKCGDALKTGHPDNYFDVVIAGELLEHLEQPEKLIVEMVRITKPGGFINLSTPNDEIHLREHIDDYHLWNFELKDIREMAGKYFKIIKISILGNYIICHGTKQ